jgi:hypothetical protein
MSPNSRQPLPRTPGDSLALERAEETVPSVVEGLALAGDGGRTGEDTRKRGWFWHWNAMVTQFAPLVGLKGVGLLNSYTVWTDRREESPHRGYAFPSQQSEADFYGEDRAELITINKILVALDLIEIRKEMVLRVDESGRRWRVPHNLYRVKDRDDGFQLTSEAVDRVVQLASSDRTVYRYIRHIFSPKFKPIDANNVWTGILETLSETPTWQLLAARTAQEEAKASARTKAGHRSRKSASGPAAVDLKALTVTTNDSESVDSEPIETTIVAKTNNGLGVDVAPTNRGSKRKSPTTVAATNGDEATDVAPSNTTYHQEETTTTTEKMETKQSYERAISSVPHQVSFGPGGSEAPADRAGQEEAFRTFHDANHRDPTIAERKLLKNLAERFDPAARACGMPELMSGWQWVAAAIVDAVDAGSTYVAPRRVREILARWEREGVPGSENLAPPASPETILLGANMGIMLPHGRDSGSTWAYAVKLLGLVLGQQRLATLVTGTAIAGFVDDAVIIEATTIHQARSLDGEYRDLVVRKLSEAIRRPVGLTVRVAGAQTSRALPAPVVRAARNTFMIDECGLTSAQVWDALIDDVVRSGSVRPADASAWLRPASLIDRLADGTFVIGAPNSITAKRIHERFAAALADALADLIGGDVELRVVIANEWTAEMGGGDAAVSA